jgi:glycosyltransferase involved in cell wall biosynthesis
VRILTLYRPCLPEMRAQAIQVMHTSHALAVRGHDVTVIADRSRGFAGTGDEALDAYGLLPHPSFHVVMGGTTHPTAAGIRFRAEVLRWLAAGRRSSERSVVYARAKRYAAWIQHFRTFFPFRLVIEAHEVDSAQADERGESTARMRRLEAKVLSSADGLVTNCEGTLELLREVHGNRLPEACRVVHNGTSPARSKPRASRNDGRVLVGYVGSLRGFKDIRALVEAGRTLPEPFAVRLIGGRPGEPDYDELAAQAGSRLEVRPGVPYRAVTAELAELDVLVLCLGRNLYSRRLASPLKLWDYLATSLPVVAPDLPSVRAVCGDPDGDPPAFYAWEAGSDDGLVQAIRRAALAGERPPRLRTWDDRACEVEEFLESLRW